jgi:hypothetical protein
MHQLLSREWDDLTRKDGSPAEMLPKLNGISGCSVWQVFRGGRDASRWSSTDIRIVAVQTGVYKRSIKGTRRGAVAYLLSRQYPELRPHLTLNGCTPADATGMAVETLEKL